MSSRWVLVSEASEILGVSKEAIRKRMDRETIPKKKNESGQWTVLVEDDRHATSGQVQDGELERLRSEVEYLRQENERKDHMIMSLINKVPQLEAPNPGSAEQPSPEKEQKNGQEQVKSTGKGFFSRFFGN